MAQNYTENCFDSNNAALNDMQAIENNMHCLKTCFSGSSAPPSSTGFMLWGDSANSVLKIRSANNNDWLTLARVSTANSPYAAAYSLLRTVTAGSGLSGGGTLTSDITISVASGGITETMLGSSAVTASKLSTAAVTFGHLPTASAQIYSWQVQTSSTGVGPASEEATSININTTPGTKFGFYLYKTSAMTYVTGYVRASVASVTGYVRLYNTTTGASSPPGGINGGPYTQNTGALNISGLANDTIHWIQVQFYCNSGSGTYGLYSFQAFVS